jgi:hypothetical protein
VANTSPIHEVKQFNAIIARIARSWGESEDIEAKDKSSLEESDNTMRSNDIGNLSIEKKLKDVRSVETSSSR